MGDRGRKAVAHRSVRTGDLAALQGAWIQTGFEEDGLVDAPDMYEGAMGAITTITGSHFSVRSAQGLLLLEGHFTLDEHSTPKQVNWTDAMGPDAGQTLKAIYELEGGDFRFIAAAPGAPPSHHVPHRARPDDAPFPAQG